MHFLALLYYKILTFLVYNIVDKTNWASFNSNLF